jgi:hypothetical protein
VIDCHGVTDGNFVGFGGGWGNPLSFGAVCVVCWLVLCVLHEMEVEESEDRDITKSSCRRMAHKNASA